MTRYNDEENENFSTTTGNGMIVPNVPRKCTEYILQHLSKKYAIVHLQIELDEYIRHILVKKDGSNLVYCHGKCWRTEIEIPEKTETRYTRIAYDGSGYGCDIGPEGETPDCLWEMEYLAEDIRYESRGTVIQEAVYKKFSESKCRILQESDDSEELWEMILDRNYSRPKILCD